MLKRIIIFSQAMEIGGAEKALLGLLNSFDYTNYQVDLFYVDKLENYLIIYHLM